MSFIDIIIEIAPITIKLLVLFFFGHVLADMGLQTRAMAMGKNRHRKPEYIPEGQVPYPTWRFYLTGHGGIHGLMVTIITGNIWFGILETILHTSIDFMKCDNKLNPEQDQILHYLCKIFYTVLILLFYNNYNLPIFSYLPY